MPRQSVAVAKSPRKSSSSKLTPTPEEAPSATTTPSRRAKRSAPSSQTSTPAKKSKRTATAAAPKYKEDSDAEIESETIPEERVKTTATAKSPNKSNKKPDTDGAEARVNGAISPPLKKKRKTKEDKAAEAMPLAPRTQNLKHYIGAHVSAAGGVHNAVPAATHIGGNSFALFLKSQRKWANPALADETAAAFHDACKKHVFAQDQHCLPHGSYLVNLAAADKDKADQAYGSFLDDLQRCHRLGIKLYNFHPGNTNGLPRSEALARLASQLNRAHADSTTGSVVTVLENMAAATTANTIGGAFADLRTVIDLVTDKSRVGVCIDTCHAFAAGYDLRTPDAFAATMAEFDAVVGPQYLRAVHLNDSKGVLASHRDLHQNIGLGFLGLRAFHNLMNDPRFHGLPLVLETPIDTKDDKGKPVEDKAVWAREIKLLESLVGMDADGDEFKRLEAELAKKGEAERDKLREQFDRKASGTPRKKPAAAGAKKKRPASDAEDSDVD